MGVEDGVRTARFLEDGPQDPGVQSCLPSGGMNPHASRLEPAHQLGSGTGDHYLLDSAAGERPGEQPDLPLPASPLSTGGEVDDRRAHVLGRASAGQLPLSRTAACGPLSRTTSASSVRSSARLNGLWR